MPACPECGGELKFDRSHYVYVCRACGLSLTRGEYERAREAPKREEDEKERSRREYLKWWLGSKK